MLSEEAFQEGMAVLCSMFDREPSDFLLRGYYLVLKNLTDEQFQTAITAVLENRKYTKLPMPAEIKEHVFGNTEDLALIALDKFEKGMRKIGRYRTAVFDDPLIHAAVEALGGWVQCCSYEWEEWKFRRQEFVRLYKAFAANPDRVSPPKMLAGHAEIMNAFNGHNVKPEIETYGDKAKALEWTSDVVPMLEQKKC